MSLSPSDIFFSLRHSSLSAFLASRSISGHYRGRHRWTKEKNIWQRRMAGGSDFFFCKIIVIRTVFRDEGDHIEDFLLGLSLLEGKGKYDDH